MRHYLPFSLCFLLLACSTATEKLPGDYHQVIQTFSDGDVEYSGFYNTFKYRATLMNTRVQTAYIDHKAKVYKWDNSKRVEQLKKLQEDNSKETTVFMSFFTPRRQDDNLHQKKTIWNVYLETANGRYEGKVSKYNVSDTETMVMYPYHSGWATAYKVVFPVSIVDIEGSPSKMTIAGPLGSKDVHFPGN